MSIYSSHSDQELVVLLKQGDHAAFAEVSDWYNSLLYIHAFRKLRNREEAKDYLVAEKTSSDTSHNTFTTLA